MGILENKRTYSAKLNAVFYLTATCCLAACNGGGTTADTSESTTSATTQIVSKAAPITNNDLYLMHMGSGYDSITHTATSGQTCLANASNPENIYIGSPSSSITFDHEQALNLLQNALNVDVSSPYRGNRFDLSMASQFVQSAKDDLYTMNLRYLYKYSNKAIFKDGSLGHGLNALTPYAASLLQTSPTKFRTMCGNSFIEQMDAGSVLAVNLSLHFNSHSEKQRFVAQMNATTGLGNILTFITQAAAKSNVNANIVLSAVQLGGQPEKLNQLFGQPEANEVYPAAKCEVNGSNTCALMINNIITYAQTMSTQLTDTGGSLDLSKLYYSNPTVTNYANLGIPVQEAPNPSPEILSAMAQLTSQYDKTIYDYNFVTHYKELLADKLDTQTKDSLNDAAQKLGNQINNVFKSPSYDLLDCYKGYVSTQCLTIRDNVENALKTFQLNPAQADLIDYLEDNSYSGFILNYYGDANPTPADYRFPDSECIFAPISNANMALYAINCNGQWLSTSSNNGVNILPAFGGSGIFIKNLAYISTPPNSNSNGQLIVYYDIILPADVYYDNYFYNNPISVFAPEFSTTDSSLGLTRLYENQA